MMVTIMEAMKNSRLVLSLYYTQGIGLSKVMWLNEQNFFPLHM